MKKVLISAALLLSPSIMLAQYTNTAQAGVTFFTGANAAAAVTSAAIRLPSFSGSGTLTVPEAGVTGSPSGCQVTLAYQSNATATTGAVVSTTSFTPSTGTQTFTITPSQLTGDTYVAAYTCGTTYPTAGSITASFSPVNTVSADPCVVSPKSTVSIAISTATTTQLVALATGKAIYVCGFTATVGASSTIQFEYGTGSACGNGTTALTGVFTPATAAVLSLTGEGTKITAPASNALCAVSTGTGGINGVLTYSAQ